MDRQARWAHAYAYLYVPPSKSLMYLLALLATKKDMLMSVSFQTSVDLLPGRIPSSHVPQG